MLCRFGSLQKSSPGFSWVLPSNESSINVLELRAEHSVSSSSDVDFGKFWSSAQARRLKNADAISSIVTALNGETELLFDLTFYARFAHRTFAVMRREGKDAMGFDRMQQSFAEAVEKVQKVLVESEQLGFSDAAAYTSVDAQSFARLIDLIGDLAIVKDWMLTAKAE